MNAAFRFLRMANDGESLTRTYQPDAPSITLSDIVKWTAAVRVKRHQGNAMSQNAIIVCSTWFGVMSLATFIVYGIDKRRAKQEGGDRISEKTLHVLSLLGGWPGAIAGQKLFRHKTCKKTFRLVFWLSVLGNLIESFLVYGAFQHYQTWFS